MSHKYLRYLILFVVLAALVAVTPRSAPAQGSGPDALIVREADSGTSVSLQADQLLVLDLEENLSTGFAWEVTGLDSTNLKQLETTFVPAPPRADGKPWVGAPGRQVLRFAALKTGASTLTLGYRRSWESVSPARTFSVRVTGAAPVTGAALAYIAPSQDMTPSKDQTAPLASMVAASTIAAPAPGATTELSATLNWCSTDNPLGRNVCTAVKNQGSCGSCWAFGTEGVVEAAINKADGVDRDTSEQYLVSCYASANGCNGGWWAFGMAINQVPVGETNPGVRWEEDFHYEAAAVPCNPPYTAHELFVSSGSVASSGTITDQVAAIKQAITDYGPVAAAVCVGPQFSAYKSGIFATDEVANCNGSVNHAIVLYGWDDTDQVWYLRNSWAPTWGEGGNMRIKWGTSKVGYGATYAVYNGPTANYNIAGYVRTPDGLGVANAWVTFNNARAVWTNSAGYYVQTGFSNGSYTVRAGATNYTISPTQQTAVVNGANITDVNFTGTQPAQYHRISGYVQQPNGAGIPGATVSFAGTATRPSVKTDTFGFFSQDSVLSGTYTVTVVASGYTLTPTYQVATVTTADVLVDPFIGSRITYTLTGYIKTTAGVGIPGVTVGFDGDFPDVTTDANGFWSRDGVYSGHPHVIPVKEGWVLNPALKILTVKADQNNINFTGSLATYNLTGTVQTAEGVSINGVTVSFGGVQPAVTTSGDGYFRTGFVSGTVVVVSPTLSGYTFTPPSQQLTFGPADAGASFIGTALPVLHDISGVIQKENGDPVPNVSVSFGAARPPVTTDSSGVFTQTGFPDGLYTLEPALSGYSFDPPTQTFTLSGSDKTDADFMATQLIFSISGRVVVNGAGVPATLSFGDALSTAADASGYYTMTGLQNGEYAVGPGYPGSQFTPAEQVVVINGSDAVNIDFDGALLTYCVSGYARWIYINTPIAGATVTFSGTTVLTTTTDAQGLYQRCDISYGNQRIKFQSPNKYFSSSTRDVAVIGDLSNADTTGWTGYFTTTGQVVDGVGNPMPNVTVNALESGANLVTDSSGWFTHTRRYNTLTYVPKRTGYTFTPASITVNADGTDHADLVFTATAVLADAPTAATYALVGHVRDGVGNGIPGAMIYYEDGPDKIYLSTSGPDGLYVVQGIPSGTTYSFVGAYHPGYDFPSGWTLTNITSDVTDLDFDGTQIMDFMVGRAQLQGHFDAPSDHWWFGYPLTVELFTPGGTEPIATHEVTLDSWGYFVVPGVTPGVYDVRIKNHHSLSQKLLNVAVDAQQLVLFNMLHEGDTTNDDVIWYDDFDSMQRSFATCIGDAHYNPIADIDDDGCVWGYDISLLTTNFGIGGQTSLTSVAPTSTPALDSATLRSRVGVYNDASHQVDAPASAHGYFTLTPADVQNLAVGDIFTVTVGVRAPDRGLDTVSAYLNFDPNYLEVVDADGAPTDRVVPAATLPLIIVNQVHNNLGYIDLVVNRPLGSVPVTGNFDLATLRFRLKQKTAGTFITFDNTDPWQSISEIALESYGYLNRNVAFPDVLVSSANHAPTVADDQYATTKDTVLHVSAPGATANDIDVDGDAFWLTEFYPPLHGDMILYDDGSFVYTPTLGFVGTDDFIYRASDGLNDSNWATATIIVNAANAAPVAVSDSYTTTANTALTVAAPGVLGNDTDVDGPSALTSIKVSEPAHGVVTLNADGSFVYTPTVGYYGSDSFTYKANDGVVDSNIATVTLTVNHVNHAPVAVSDSYTATMNTTSMVTAPGVLGNDTDSDGNTLMAIKVSDPAHGTLMLNTDGSFTYTPVAGYTGSDSFTYKANDGALDSNVVTVTLNVQAVVYLPIVSR